MALPPDPPWLDLLNALQSEWRLTEILRDRNPDPYLETQLRANGVWPRGQDSASHSSYAAMLRQHVAMHGFRNFGHP